MVGKLVNIASRCAGFIERGGGKLAEPTARPALYAEFAALRGTDRRAVRHSATTPPRSARSWRLADRANQYVDRTSPGRSPRIRRKAAEVRAVCTQGINLFRALMSYLAPVLPRMCEAAGEFLGTPIRSWSDAATPLLGVALNPYQPLATRLDPALVARLVQSPARACCCRRQ